MKNKKWIIAEKQTDNIIDQILINRNISPDDRENFLHPNFDNLFDPYKLNNMSEAVERIKEALAKSEVIGIFADYDADGVPAAALISEFLENKLQLKTIVYIPSRAEGYGLNKKGIDFLRENKVTLIITADLGIRDIENTKYAKSLGLDVIITDHHEPGEFLPNALAIINPKLKNSTYPFRELSGGGVIFKLIQALSKEFPQITQTDLKWALDLVGITTICDVVPLISENRIFAKYGLIVLQKTKRIGLKKLYEVSTIDAKNIDTYTVGFQIGPRLNAPGRMEQKNESFNLLRTTDDKEALLLARNLQKINIERQFKLDQILKDVEAKIVSRRLFEKKVILIADKNLSSGLIGLVAGRIVEQYSRPTLILNKGLNISKGSARSIDKFNIVDVLEQSKDLLINYGGHAKAAGLTIENEQIKGLYTRLLEIADKKLSSEDLKPKVNIDFLVQKNDLTIGLIDKIKNLEPFGLGNAKPVFVLKEIKPENLQTVGQSKHLKFSIGQISVIGFNMGALIKEISGKSIDLAFNIDQNIWNNKRTVQLKIVDIKINENFINS